MNEVVITIAWAAVFLAAIQGFTSYCLVKLVITGKAALFERRHDKVFDGEPRIVGMQR